MSSDVPAASVRSAELLHEIFERQAAAVPERVAIRCGPTSLTYAQANACANQLARFLRGCGIGCDDCVGLLVPRSANALVAILGILKAGAAYVPIDPDYPLERVAFILKDSKAKALVSTADLAPKAAEFGGKLVLLDKQRDDLERLSAAELERANKPEDLCYVIYTSGTTGKPKGVEIIHRSVCHLVRAEADIFKIRPEDNVFQGASLAFDASVEEIWSAFHAGATLVVGTSDMVHSGPALAGMLAEAGVTVLSCVPTLLLMMEEDVPTLRLLILGGEPCPPGLVKRWWQPGRRILNTYGPTETTVVATWAECHPDRPVTIGRPLADYSVCIVDEHLQPVPTGASGELCIGGIGLARGYLGRPELTREKFVELTARAGSQAQRYYRTGDLTRWTEDGELEFLGRIDTQVKLRGFRIELGEIESVLIETGEVKACAVALREDAPGSQQLVGYLVMRTGEKLDEEKLRERLRAKLPSYMVPAIIEVVDSLPVLASGKVDRKSLPPPKSSPAHRTRQSVEPRTPLERQLANVWRPFFAPLAISINDDFFLDLGGHSLLAARVTSALRSQPGLAALSVRDLYQHPSIERLARELEQRQAAARASVAPETAASSQPPAQPVPFWRHFLCGSAQFFSLFFVLTFVALQWLAPYLTYTLLIEEEYGYQEALLGAFASLVLFYPVMLLLPILLKWLVIGRYRPGVYPLWGFYFFRWWLVTTIEAAVPVGYLTGTPLLNLYLRLMGAKVGRDVYVGSESFAIYDLLSIGEGSSINAGANLLGYTIEDGWLKLGSIAVGKGCFVGSRATVGTNTFMEDGSALEDLSLLSHHKRIPAGQTWKGSPAANKSLHLPGSTSIVAGEVATPRASGFEKLLSSLLHALGLLLFPVLVVAALFPGIVLMNELNYLDPYYWYLLLAPLVGLSFVLLLALELAAVKWLLLGRVKPGVYPLRSWFYFRKWFVDQTMDLSLDVLGPLYASVYLTPWYKLLGAKLGSGAEISTASFISPDLLVIGPESFIADNVSLGAPRVRDGQMTIGKNQIGARSFIGNSAMLPPGTVIGDKVLVGCLSAPPTNPADALREDTTWLGSPAILVPERQKSAAFGEEATFAPPARLRVLRAIIEFVRVIAPSTGFIVLTSLLFSSLLLLRDYFTVKQTLLFFPFLYIGCGLTAALFTIAVKWLVVGRYRAGEKPLWSGFVWRNELLNALHEHLAEPFLVGALTGTPFVCWYFRLLGARIGRRVYLETTDFSEFDLASIGDEAALNADCTVQTHLFEDRVMKMSSVEIGPRCTVGAGSLVLYDTRMQADSKLGDLSLLMKGEVLQQRTEWQGSPAANVR